MTQRDADSTDLFGADVQSIVLDPGAVVLRGFASRIAGYLLAGLEGVICDAPLRHMETPDGRMSVAMTSCGDLGWVIDESGDRYDPCDPFTGRPWPRIPAVYMSLAERAAEGAGFAGFAPNACLINRCIAGSRLSLYRDRAEENFNAPIVSVSLGIPATLLWGAASPADEPKRILLAHGDVVVWGGASRMTFHGIDTLREGEHPATGSVHYNLTFRKAG
jgi:alkylated DNA repair protein (DNA oxidative demethylase)